MKRRLLSITIIMTILMSIVSPAWAQGTSAKISQDEAMKIAREAFGISDNLKNVQVGYREEEYNGNKKIWEFNWELSRYGKYHNIRVEVDADSGDIISYNEFRDINPKNKPAKLKSKQECQKIAADMVKKLASQKWQELVEKEYPIPEYLDWGNGARTYSFRYVRHVNGIPFPENNLNLSINAETGKIASYWFMWDNTVSFPSADQTIKPEQAEKVFREKIGLSLNYFRPYGPYPPGPRANQKPVGLYYTFGDQFGRSGIIDAFNGKAIDQNGTELSVREKVYYDVKEEPVPEKTDKVLSLEEAKALAAKYVKIPAGYELQSSRYNEGWGLGSQKMWDFQFGPKDFRGGNSFGVGINAVTGDMINYHNWREPWTEQKESSINYDYDKCKKIALDYIKKVAPNKFDYLYLFENPSFRQQVAYYNGKAVVAPTYNFNFIRIVNGVPYSNNNINVEVDNNTGEIRGFWSGWENDLQFVSPDSVISEQEAVDKFLAQQKLTLAYTRKTSQDGRPSKDLMLVYLPDNELPKIVEALTGKVSSSYDLDSIAKLDDITGHWAEREIRILSAWGIVSGSNNKFQPDKPVTRAEFITMLVAAKGLEADSTAPQAFTDIPKTAWYYNAVQAAAKAGIIQGSGGKFEPNKVITKQEIVVMVIKALDPDAGLDVPGELPQEFKDADKIAPWAKGALVQAVEMGIIAGQDGYLKPATPATRAEAAVILIRTLDFSQNGGGSYRVYG